MRRSGVRMRRVLRSSICFICIHKKGHKFRDISQCWQMIKYCCGFQVHLGELYLALPGSPDRGLPGSRYRAPSGSWYLQAPGPPFRVPGAVIVYQKRVSWGSGLLLGSGLKIPI